MAKQLARLHYTRFPSCSIYCLGKSRILVSQQPGVVLSWNDSRHSRHYCKLSTYYYPRNKEGYARGNTDVGNRRVLIGNGQRLFHTGTRTNGREPWMISSDEVNDIIRKKECSEELQCGIINRYEANELASNQPIEDRKFVARCLHFDNAYLFSVLDGHGGPHAAHCVSQRLADYIAVSVLPREVLLSQSSELPAFTKSLVQHNYKMYDYAGDPVCQLSLQRFYHGVRMFRKRELPSGKISVGNFSPKHDFHSAYGETYHLNEEHSLNLMKGMSQAFLRLDTDMGMEALPHGEDENICEHAFSAVASGACGVVAFIQETELCVANVGDCRAVLGVQEKDGSWTAVPLSTDHTASNPGEVQRIYKQHPPDEAPSIIRHGRLLGSLAPLRSFGDMKFKWDKKTQRQVFRSMSKPSYAEVKEYLTPPYLTAEPEVSSYQLNSSDKFLILASDGLWDVMTNEEAVLYVKEHEMYKQRVLTSQQRDITITYDDPSSPCEMDNAASCLIREALGGSDHVLVSTTLSIPYPDRRMYRDDITVMTVVHEYINELIECADVFRQDDDVAWAY